MIRALVVDFDGPVFDARAARDRAYDSTVSQFADRLGASTIHLGSTPLYGPTRFVANAFPGLPEALRGEVLDFYRRELTRLELEASISSPTRSWLERLHQTVDVCIFTGRLQDNIEQLLEAFGLQDLFRVVVGQGGVHDPKPAPDGLLHIMELLMIEDPRTILMLGDSDLDFAAAADAGIGYRHAAWSLEPSTVPATSPGGSDPGAAAPVGHPCGRERGQAFGRRTAGGACLRARCRSARLVRGGRGIGLLGVRLLDRAVPALAGVGPPRLDDRPPGHAGGLAARLRGPTDRQ